MLINNEAKSYLAEQIKSVYDGEFKVLTLDNGIKITMIPNSKGNFIAMLEMEIKPNKKSKPNYFYE